jgi:hypothetical protein
MGQMGQTRKNKAKEWGREWGGEWGTWGTTG